MSRILEFQPTDEQTVVSRVLIELHQAIDQHFPGANPGSRQFTKTVLTSQSESTRIDNLPGKPTAESRGLSLPGEVATGRQTKSSNLLDAHKPELSMTPKSGVKLPEQQVVLGTADVRHLIGESLTAQMTNLVLILLLVSGIGVTIWLLFFRSIF